MAVVVGPDIDGGGENNQKLNQTRDFFRPGFCVGEQCRGKNVFIHHRGRARRRMKTMLFTRRMA